MLARAEERPWRPCALGLTYSSSLSEQSSGSEQLVSSSDMARARSVHADITGGEWADQTRLAGANNRAVGRGMSGIRRETGKASQAHESTLPAPLRSSAAFSLVIQTEAVATDDGTRRACSPHRYHCVIPRRLLAMVRTAPLKNSAIYLHDTMQWALRSVLSVDSQPVDATQSQGCGSSSPAVPASEQSGASHVAAPARPHTQQVPES